MPVPLHVLILEDSASDAELELYQLKRAGFEPHWTRVQTESDFIAQLRPELNLIIADYQLPQFDGRKALQRLQESGLDIPFIIVSGAIGEELAVDLMKQGVSDYLQKDRLARLGQAVHRALEQRRDRQEKARAMLELQQLAARMEYQAQTFDTLLSAVPDLLSLYGADQRLTYANQAMLQLWGKSLDLVVGKTLSELTIQPKLTDRFAAEFGETLAGKNVRNEVVIKAPSGQTAYYDYFFTPVFSEQQKVVAVAFAARDITAHKETEESLRRERELREIFVSTLSHDLRTPLAAARMSAELLARREGAFGAAALLHGRIIDNIDRLDEMIQTLLDANLVRAGERLPLHLQQCPLRETVQDVVDELTTLHGNRFRLHAPCELDGYWDSRFLQRIVENLLNNAVKYGDPVAPITIWIEQASNEALIRVHNEGEPIKPEEQAILFEPFRRAPTSGNGASLGWGIGLTLVRGAVEAHGGRVSVESGPEIGTTFCIALPLDARQRQ